MEFLKDKNILIVGATGEIGKSLVNRLLGYNARIIITYRNKQKLEAFKSLNNIEFRYLDLIDINSINNLINDPSLKKIDYVILNSGYSNDERLYINNLEYHFLINSYSIYYFIKHSNAKFNNPKYIITSSISYKKIKNNSLSVYYNNNKIDLYAHSKRVMMQLLYILNKNNEYNLIITHPGIVYNDLFIRRNNKGIKKLILPFLKIFMHDSYSQALNIIAAMNENIDLKHWVGPKGLFECFGRPGVRKLKSNLYNIDEINYLENEINKINKEMENIYEF